MLMQFIPCAYFFSFWHLAKAGARHDVRSQYGNNPLCTPVEACLFELKDSPYGLPERYFERIAVLLVIGAKLKNFTESQQSIFDQLMVLYTVTGPTVCDTIMKSGYRPKDVDKLAKDDPKLKVDVDRFKKKYSNPLSLQQLAANAVRTRLQPNALVGARRLVEEGEISSRQAGPITLGFPFC